MLIRVRRSFNCKELLNGEVCSLAKDVGEFRNYTPRSQLRQAAAVCCSCEPV